MLRTRSVNPSQIGPWALSSFAKAQSSMRAPRIASMPPGEGIEHLKEENECWNGDALGEAFTVKLDHERSQHERIALGMCHQAADGIGRMHDIGIREQYIAWRLRQLGRGLHALLDRPEFARPARRQAAARHHVQ